jgi:7-cyano-7-deazaguanine synthase
MGEKEIAVIPMSGGMDSALCAALAIEYGYMPAGFHLNYGQRTEPRELKSFHDLCDYYNIKKILKVDAPHFKQIGGSSLTDESLEVSKADLTNKIIPTSYVPFRNGNILSMAVSWAEVIGAKAVYIGAMEEDSSGYPDCRRSFFDAFQEAINLGTKPDTNIKILTPLMKFTKTEVVSRGLELGVPFHLTWSCYQGNDIACGECDSCALRLRGFTNAGIEDPIPYLK